jgi:hypothetical protein
MKLEERIQWVIALDPASPDVGSPHAAVIVALNGLEALRDTGQGSCAERLQFRAPVGIKDLSMQAC